MKEHLNTTTSPAPEYPLSDCLKSLLMARIGINTCPPLGQILARYEAKAALTAAQSSLDNLACLWLASVMLPDFTRPDHVEQYLYEVTQDHEPPTIDYVSIEKYADELVDGFLDEHQRPRLAEVEAALRKLFGNRPNFCWDATRIVSEYRQSLNTATDPDALENWLSHLVDEYAEDGHGINTLAHQIAEYARRKLT